jgi:hypothetical protein
MVAVEVLVGVVVPVFTADTVIVAVPAVPLEGNVYTIDVPVVELILPLPVAGKIDQVKVQEEVIVVAAVLKALAVKAVIEVVPTVAIAVAGLILTDDNIVIAVKPLIVTALEASAFPAVSVTEDAGFTVVPETIIGDVPKVTVQIFRVVSQLIVAPVP